MEEERVATAHKPRTSVAFAPTPAFAEAFPSEVDAQNKLFTQPSWKNRVAEPPAEEMKAKPMMNEAFVAPLPRHNPLLAAHEEVPPVPISDALIGVAILAGVFLGGYLVYKYAWSASSGATSTLPSTSIGPTAL